MRIRTFLSPYNNVVYKYGRPLTSKEYIADAKLPKDQQKYEHLEMEYKKD